MRALVAAVAAAVLGCNHLEVEQVGGAPELSHLAIEAVIMSSDSFEISGIASDAACRIIVAGGQWGAVSLIDEAGSQREASSPVLTRRATRLERFGEESSLVWSESPPTLAVLDHGTWTEAAVDLPTHPWGRVFLGSVAGHPNGTTIGLGAFDSGNPVKSPEPWTDAPLVYVFEAEADSPPRSGGALRREGGSYLSWLASRTVVGVRGDTIAVLLRATGTIELFVRSDDLVLVSRHELPRYIESPRPREEVWVADWIQIGGELPSLLEIPQVEAAHIGPDGKIFAIRPYDAEWRRVRNRYVPTQGVWEVTERGLEVSTMRGEVLGAFALPTEAISWIRVDQHGRVFLHDAAGPVFVARDPIRAAESTCPALPSEIHLTQADPPPFGGRSGRTK